MDCPHAGVFVLENLQSLMVLSDEADSLSRERATKISSGLVNIFYEFKVSEKPKYLLLLGTDEVSLPQRMLKLIPEIHKPLPNLKEIRKFLSELLSSLPLRGEGEVDMDALTLAASGLTIEEIQIGLRLGLNRSTGKNVSYEKFLLDYKVKRLRDYGLEFMGLPNVPDFGGLDRLKTALAEVRSDYSIAAREHNIPLPKGWLLVGPTRYGEDASSEGKRS